MPSGVITWDGIPSIKSAPSKPPSLAGGLGLVFGGFGAVKVDDSVRGIAGVGIVLNTADVSAEDHCMRAVRPGHIIHELVGFALIQSDSKVAAHPNQFVAG